MIRIHIGRSEGNVDVPVRHNEAGALDVLKTGTKREHSTGHAIAAHWISDTGDAARDHYALERRAGAQAQLIKRELRR